MLDVEILSMIYDPKYECMKYSLLWTVKDKAWNMCRMKCEVIFPL